MLLIAVGILKAPRLASAEIDSVGTDENTCCLCRGIKSDYDEEIIEELGIGLALLIKVQWMYAQRSKA